MIRFISPALPVLKTAPPVGPQWTHEVKFDGWRVQLHKHGEIAVVFSRNGNDLTRRFPMFQDSVISLPAVSVIIDAELGVRH